jgi:hypothetical protein
LAWNDCQYIVLWIFRTLSGLSWEEARATFFKQNTDHNRRGITLTLMKKRLNTKNDEQILKEGTQVV